MNHLPAGPGGTDGWWYADIVSAEPLKSTKSRTTNLPDAMSFSTMCRGIPPHPTPSLMNEYLVDKSASRHVDGETTP